MPRAPDSDQRHFEALFAPTTGRSTLDLVRRRGLSPERMCKGLGFTLEELQDGAFQISYRQASLLIRRVQQAVGDPALGLSVGSRQTVVSWGVPGLAMLTCETLREAVAHIHEHQREAGAMLIHRWSQSGKDIVVEVTPRSYDSELNVFLIEEAFAGAVAVVRTLVGDRFCPKRVELAYPKPPHAAAYATKSGLEPLARIRSAAVARCAPEFMGIGPVTATHRALQQANLDISAIDVVELDEAFASQALACVQELGIRDETLNIDGGAIALGHPVGATGARIVGKAASLLRREGGRYALATQCIGGGQGIATVLERI